MIVADTILELSPRVKCHVFLREGATWRTPPTPTKWAVQLELHDEGTKIEIEVTHSDIEIAFELAWNKLKGIIDHGMPEGTLIPAVSLQLEKPEIPF